MTDVKITVRPGYESLLAALDGALNQAQLGKGAVRHGMTGKDWTDQIIFLIGRLGLDYNRGQAVKKIVESHFMERGEAGVEDCTAAAIAELEGAIVYLASRIVILREGKSRREG